MIRSSKVKSQCVMVILIMTITHCVFTLIFRLKLAQKLSTILEWCWIVNKAIQFRSNWCVIDMYGRSAASSDKLLPCRIAHPPPSPDIEDVERQVENGEAD